MMSDEDSREEELLSCELTTSQQRREERPHFSSFLPNFWVKR